MTPSTRSPSPSPSAEPQSCWEAIEIPSTRCNSPSPVSPHPQASDNDSTTASIGYSFRSQSPNQNQQLTPRKWDMSNVANIPSFVPQAMIFMQPWPQTMHQQMPLGDHPVHEDDAPAKPTPLTKKQLQKKDLSKLGNDVDASEITTLMIRGIP